MSTHHFYCSHCKTNKTHESDFTTGYARKRNGHKVCFDCMATVTEKEMLRDGKTFLYLTETPTGQYEVSNWCGTWKRRVMYASKGRHNIARVRYDVWFRVKGTEWHGVQYGDNTQVVHCKMLKSA